MAKHPIEELERHRQRGRPHRVVLLLNATIHQAGDHRSHDGDVVSHALLSLKTTSTVMPGTQIVMSYLCSSLLAKHFLLRPGLFRY